MREPPLILIVEDNPVNLDIMKTRLLANNYEVVTATDGKEGLDKAREIAPDLILLDILMPRMDGLEVCRHLKGDSSLSFIPIIMVTAKADSKDIIAGLEAGGDEYLTKPVDHAALVARVKSMLRIKELHDTVVDQATQLKIQLKTASKVQSLFWPEIPEFGEKSNIWARSVPAAYIGGDLYDVIALPDGSYLSYVADVSGKGVPAALIMAALSTKIRASATLYADLNTLVKSVNEALYDLTYEEGFFATLLIARYWPSSKTLQFIRAGHPSPVRIAGGVVRELPLIQGIALGVTSDAEYETYEFQLAGGDSVILYTDGITEAENSSHELFGFGRLTDYIQSSGGPPWGKGLLEAVDRWRGGTEVNDDLTILEIWQT
ncbi:MAG: PP2C family protein-serine/threonine phosphatase [Desulforhopalus sp.]